MTEQADLDGSDALCSSMTHVTKSETSTISLYFAKTVNLNCKDTSKNK